jgi:uncharacterized protein (TIGR00369 family)
MSITDGESTPRTRLVTWHDPKPTTIAGASMAGLDFVRAVQDLQLPTAPMHELMRISIASAEFGKVVFTCQPDESAYNAIGTVHGGLVCTLLDAVMGGATHTTMSQGRGFSSVEIKVNYLKAVQHSSGMLTATGTVVKSGSRVAFAEGAVVNASGALVATASSTLLVFDTSATTQG